MSLFRLQQGLGYIFQDTRLLNHALTHRSHSSPHNERLEFLGDGILNCVIAALLYTRHPDMPEGELSRLRSNLVRQEALFQLARELHLGHYLKLGEGELRSGGGQRPSILADALEAIFGAIFLDQGFDAARQVIERLYAPLVAQAQQGVAAKDPKTRLQEWLQGRRKALPQYQMLETTGEAHAQCFAVACDLGQFNLRTVGNGTSRRNAEQAAAEKALEALQAHE
ncbi:MAG: hypothetical protein RIR00_2682 [Pseudomonadota bacterium]|jgi:ribonuclease-3